MERKFNDRAAKELTSLRNKKRGQHVLQVLAAVVVFCTTYALILPAVTLSNETTCGLEEHTHDISCWTLEDLPPQPQLICDPESSGAIILHQHNEYCYNDLGELICALPEREGHTHSADCYTLQQTLICTLPQERGHAHSDACYSYERGALVCGQEESGHTHTDSCYRTERKQVLTCGQSESEGHTHSDSCYTVTPHQELTCGQSESDDVLDEEGNVVSPGHTHSSSCYTETEETTLTCGQSESAGHTHSDSCYTEEETRVLVCSESETGGHTHSDSCYEWNKTLTCGQEEAPEGHVHTAECYETAEVLTCRKEELRPHTHSDACYNADNERICGLPEVITHNHTAGCVYIPEATEPTEGPMLTCGKEEHTHTDLCYLEKDEMETYYCGLAAHLHTEDCYFESGALRCTIAEHVHDESCLIPPAQQVPGQPAGVWLSDEYTYETEEFLLTFHIDGFAAVPGAEEDASLPDDGSADGSASGDGAGDPDESGSTPVLPDSTGGSAPSGGDTGHVDDALPDADGAADSGAEPAASPLAAQYSAPASSEPVSVIDPADVVFSAETLDDIVPADATQEAEYDAVVSQTEEAVEEEEVLFTKILSYGLTVNGVELDLSECDVTVDVTPTPALLTSLEETASIMSIDGEDDGAFVDGDADADGEETGDAPVYTTTLADAEGVVAAAPVEEGVTGKVRSRVMAASLSNQANPTFTVEYYAYLDTAKLSENISGTLDPHELNVIDTSSKANGKGHAVLPSNGTPTKIRTLQLSNPEDKTGTVVTEQNVQQIYRSHMFSYTKAPGLQYFNIVSTKLENNYSMAEIWLPLKPGETVDEGSGWEVVIDKYTEQPLVDEDRNWKKRLYSEELRFTNRRQTAEENPSYILIEDNALIRLVYRTTRGDTSYPANFYDYDISDGKIYASANDAANHQNGKSTSTQKANFDDKNQTVYASVYQQGINSTSNYANNGNAKFVFGNSQDTLPTGPKEETWNGNTLNRANAKNEKTGSSSTFGLVTGMNPLGTDVIFASGIDAPSLFGHDTKPVTGKIAVDDYTLGFSRSGDTYTLSHVNAWATNLETFVSYPNWNKTKTNYSNNFWPMDAAEHWGGDGHDLKFGDTKKDTMRQGVGKTSDAKKPMPASDNNGPDHNAYFGMNFEIKFDLTEDYVGPLEYYFFGDDDMWVFLTDDKGHSQLICDIGGVHGSVGEYVDLWDYIKKPDTSEPVDVTKGDNSADAETHTYRLTFFYTERGASGSTCWMQFTLPTVVGVDLETSIKTEVNENHGALWIEKQVSGVESNAEFEFTLKLNGAGDNYELKTYRRTDSGELEQGTTTGTIADGSKFKLRPNEVMAITGLPKGTQYTITETPESSKGFHPSYTTQVTEIGRNEDGTPNDQDKLLSTVSQQGATATGTIGGDTIVSVVYTNLSSYELPATGGSGTGPYAIGGIVLFAMCALWYRRNYCGGEAVD